MYAIKKFEIEIKKKIFCEFVDVTKNIPNNKVKLIKKYYTFSEEY